jgi:very-short-patch-repair endonuclease
MCHSTQKGLCGNKNCQICFVRSIASHEKSKFWSDKNNISPLAICKTDHRKFLFECDCGHTIENYINHVAKGHWCAYCSNQKLCDNISCQMCFDKSFASHEKVKFWSDKNEKIPREVFKGSPKKYIFKCDCTHEFQIQLNSINNGSWCGYCSIPQKQLCLRDNCQRCFDKSLASHEKSKFWSAKNKKTAREIFRGNINKFYFWCECGHEIQISPNNISKNAWCGYCSNPPKKLCIDINCQNCFNKSFASNEKAKFWSDKNEKTAREVFKFLNEKIIFNCQFDHEFKSVLSSISNGNWCPICKNKTEKKLFDWLDNTISKKILCQKRFNWCCNLETNNKLPFDFYIEELKLIIELDGGQHFLQVMNWKSPDIQRKNDIYKMSKALENGISIIRLLQDDVWNDKNDWNNKLKNAIKIYEIPEVIYLSDNKIYELHQDDMKKLLESIKKKDSEQASEQIIEEIIEQKSEITPIIRKIRVIK